MTRKLGRNTTGLIKGGPEAASSSQSHLWSRLHLPGVQNSPLNKVSVKTLLSLCAASAPALPLGQPTHQIRSTLRYGLKDHPNINGLFKLQNTYNFQAGIKPRGAFPNAPKVELFLPLTC